MNYQLQEEDILLDRYQIKKVYPPKDRRSTLRFEEATSMYTAIDTHLQRPVFIKEMPIDDQQRKDLSELELQIITLKSETYSLAKLNGYGAPLIYDYVIANGFEYLVLEFIKGDKLANVIRQYSIPSNIVINWAIDILGTLEVIHNLKDGTIIHRNITPYSIMITDVGKARLTGFTLAKRLDLTMEQLIGTEGYSGPESYKGKSSQLSDLYMLGATLHHLLTRINPQLQPPFSFSERPIKSLNPDVSSEFSEIVETVLSFDSADRFQSATLMKEALIRISSNHNNNTGKIKQNYSVFVSYSRKDADMLKRIKASLSKLGISVWTDEKLEPGEPSWKKAIERAITSSVAVIALFSPDAKVSSWVEEELNFARIWEIPIIPVVIRGNEKESVPFGWGSIQRIDMRSDDTYDAAVDNLATIIRRRIINPPNANQ